MPRTLPEPRFINLGHNVLIIRQQISKQTCQMEESACLEHEEWEDMATDSSPLYWPHDALVKCLDKNSINIQCTPLMFPFKERFHYFL